LSENPADLTLVQLNHGPSKVGSEIISGKENLGVDVPAGDFLGKVRQVGAQIVATSALLTTTAAETSVVLEGLKKAGIREKVKVIIGGAATTPALAEQMGVDGFGKDALDGLEMCKRWVESRKLPRSQQHPST